MNSLVKKPYSFLNLFWIFARSIKHVMIFLLFWQSSASPLNMPSLVARTADHLPLAKKAMDYFDSSPDPFHAVQTSVDQLTAVGFEQISLENNYDSVKPGGKYFYTKNKSTLVAFTVGKKFTPMQSGFKIIGGHTDSPNLKVKPRSKRSGSGCIQLAVECYGGGLWHTWFDRDLGISGRVLVRTSSGKIEQKLIKIDRPILRIPNLAIHLQQPEERTAFKLNKEDHLVPIIALEVKKALSGKGGGDKNEAETEKPPPAATIPDDKDGWVEYQEPLLLQLIGEELDLSVKDIVDFELNLFDIQKASIGGVCSEFLHSARLDNLASCFVAVQALVGHSADETLEEDSDVSMIALFDHEEVGSTSQTGAGSPVMAEAVEWVSTALNNGVNTPSAKNAAVKRSFVLSVDQAHAVHPNYSSRHEKGHGPKMNEGIVIKRNSNQRYATNTITGFLVREVARKAGLPPVQEFVVRNDCGCGSTIGPTISAATGIRVIDMGLPQLSMHSIRETMGVCDLTIGLNLFKAFYKHFREVDDSLDIETV